MPSTIGSTIAFAVVLLAGEMGLAAGSFAYQGFLQESGAPARGNYELRFEAFNSPVGGESRGYAATNLVELESGVFSCIVELGSDVFSGAKIWIETGVRTNGSTAPFVSLAPRQLVSSVPQAIFAESTPAAGIKGILPDDLFGSSIVQLSPDGTFSGAVRLTNPENTFVGDGAMIRNLDAGNLTGRLTATNPEIRGVVQFGSDIASVEETIQGDFAYPAAPPPGHVWRSLVSDYDSFGNTNWCVIRRSPIGLNPPWSQPILPTGYASVAATEYVFGLDGDSFVIVLRGIGSVLGIEVDGADDGTRYTTASDVKTHFYRVNFASRARRQVAIKLTRNHQFAGIFLSKTNTVWPALLPKQFRMIVVGDSFSEEVVNPGWTSHLMRLFTNLDVWSSSVGATGYRNPGAPGRVNFNDRLANDVLAHDPDFVLFAGGINDISQTTNDVSTVALQDACLSAFQAVQTALPDTRIVVLGPFWPRTPVDPSVVRVGGAISNACAIAGLTDSYIDTVSSPWVTGTWDQPGSGSAVRYTSSDGTHPTSEGAWNIAYRVAAELVRRFPELQPRERVR